MDFDLTDEQRMVRDTVVGLHQLRHHHRGSGTARFLAAHDLVHLRGCRTRQEWISLMRVENECQRNENRSAP
jgi:hypothetical protein